MFQSKHVCRGHSHAERLQSRAAANQAQNADVGECNTVADVDVLQIQRLVAGECVVVNAGAMLERKCLLVE